MTWSLPRGRRGAFVCVLGLATAGCGGGGAPLELAASGAWARTTPTGATNGVVYLSLTTDVADTVVGATVPASVAATAELHQTTTVGEGGAHQHGGAPSPDVVTMTDVGVLELDPGEPLVFEPGGNHIMLVGLPDRLERGERFELTLELGSGRSLVVDVTVADNPPDR